MSIRAAIWGLGRHAERRILPAMKAARGVELLGVCSRNNARVSAVCAEYRCKGWSDPAEMLKDPDVDAIYLVTASHLHAQHATLVVDAGRHLWCEKPFTCSRRETMELLSRAEDAGLAACEGHMFLHHPQFARLRQYLDDNRVGTVHSVVSRFGIPPLEYESFRSANLAGSGAFLDVGCYPIAAVQAIFPGVEKTVRYARVTGTGTIDTGGHAIIGLGDHATAYLEWWTGVGYCNEIDVWGSRGSIYTSKFFSKSAEHLPEFCLSDSSGAQTVERAASGDHFVAMIESFGAAVCDPVKAQAERDRVSKTSELMDAVWTSARRESSGDWPVELES